MSLSIDIWPPAPEALGLAAAKTQEREVAWLMNETLSVCTELKHGLEDCYALLAPIDPGSTLVMSTPRNERVKGTLTRVGTRIVKGTLTLQLRTLPSQTISISPSSPIHIPPLDTLHTHLTQAIDLVSLTLSHSSHSSPAPALASTLGLLADSLAASSALLKGPPPDNQDWLHASCPHSHFAHPLPSPALGLHIALHDCSLVVTLRSLEPANASVHIGTKLGLAIGTVRRLEHDEMDRLFAYYPDGNGSTQCRHDGPAPLPSASADVQQVHVREKVRVESADPSLISLYSKLGYLSHMLGQARRNLSIVMGTDVDD